MGNEIPDQWIQARDISIQEMIARDKAVCQSVREVQISKGFSESDLFACDFAWGKYLISEIYQPGDKIHWFNNFEFCPGGGEKALDGYVIVRDGEQIGFELSAGIHNNSLKRHRQKAAAP